MRTSQGDEKLNDSWFQEDAELKRKRRTWRLRRIASEHPPASKSAPPPEDDGARADELNDSWFH